MGVCVSINKANLMVQFQCMLGYQEQCVHLSLCNLYFCSLRELLHEIGHRVLRPFWEFCCLGLTLPGTWLPIPGQSQAFQDRWSSYYPLILPLIHTTRVACTVLWLILVIYHFYKKALLISHFCCHIHHSIAWVLCSNRSCFLVHVA